MSVHRWHGALGRMEIDGDVTRVTFRGQAAGAVKAELMRRWDGRQVHRGVPCTITLGTSPHYVWVVVEAEPVVSRHSVTLWESEDEAERYADGCRYAPEVGFEWVPMGDPGEHRWWLTDRHGEVLRRVSIECMVPGRGAS